MQSEAAHIDDMLLIDRCMSGHEAAARELFRRHHKRVHATLYRVLGANTDMDDLMQEAFFQVFRSLPSFRGDAKLSTWIDRVTVRVALRYIRTRGRAVPTVELADPAAASSPVDDRVVAREAARRLYAVLDSLSATARVAWSLHEIDGRSISEVAKLVGASVTATKLRVWRARRAVMARAAQDPVLSELIAEVTQ